MWKNNLLSLTVALNLALLPIFVTYAQEQQPEKQQPGEQQPEKQQPGEQQPGEQQPEEKQPEKQQPEEKQPDSSQSTSSTTSTTASSASAAASAGGMSVGVIAGVVGGIAAVAAGGGSSSASSSSSSSTYSSTTSGTYAAEYAANDALAFQNILSLNDYGYTGDGIKVSVVDSGIDASHQEFDGKTIYGVDFASSPSSYDEDENGHGTHVASIIAGERDTSGMRGMAYDATLYSYKMDNDGDSGLEYASSDANIANIFNQHVTDNIQVSNNSWGVATEINTLSEATLRATYALTIPAMRAAQNNGAIIVYASGNDTQSQVGLYGGLPYRISELEDEWLVVTSVDSAGTEAYYTNRCGVAYTFCVTAVGGDLTTAAGGVYGAKTGTNDSSTSNYVNLQGTSMAAPHVSGLAAALMEKFPSLTAAQIVTRIKSGASYTGLTGRGGETSSNSSTAAIQAIFGHGLINSEASASVMGTLTYAVGQSLNSSVNVGAQKIGLPAALPSLVQNDILKAKFAVFDSFDGARFLVTGEQIFESNFQRIAPAITKNAIYETGVDKNFNFTNDTFGEQNSRLTPKFLVSALSNEITATDALWGPTAVQFQSSTATLAENRTNFVWETNIGNMTLHPFIETRASEGVDQSFGGFGLGFRYTPIERLSLLAGFRNSQHTLLNGLFEEAYSNGRIRDFEFGVKSQVDNQSSIFARYIHSKIEDIDATNVSFGFDSANTSGWTTGYEIKYNNNHFVFGASKPNEVSDGRIAFVHPVGRTRSGQILYTESQFDIANNQSYERYFLFNRDFGKKRLSLGLIEDRYNHGKLGAAKLDISFTF